MADMTHRLAPERIAEIGFRYTQTKGTVRSIAKSARMSMDQFYALREQQGWPAALAGQDLQRRLEAAAAAGGSRRDREG
jgi:hypothetical protein